MTAQQISPDMVLGKRVVNDRGERVGEVVDVGVHQLDRVKFLLVEGTAREERFVRLGVDLIDSVGREVVILKQA